MLHNRFRTIRTVLALVLREMSTTYGKSPGGYIWAILEPAGGIAMMSVAFGLVFHSPALGVNFPIFYATGYLPFMLYMQVSQKTADSIKFSKPLLKYPSVTFFDALLGRFILNTLVHLLVFYVVIIGILVLFETHTIIKFPAIVGALSMAAGLGFAVGSVNCFLFSMFPVWRQVWTILNRPMFIISAIFFTFEALPKGYQGWLWYNPLIHVIGEMRRGFYPTYDAIYVSYSFVVGLILILIATGIGFLSLYYRIILNR